MGRVCFLIFSASKEFFTQANLNNVIDAFAGLYVLEKAYIKSIANEEEIKLIRKSKLFEKEENVFLVLMVANFV